MAPKGWLNLMIFSVNFIRGGSSTSSVFVRYTFFHIKFLFFSFIKYLKFTSELPIRQTKVTPIVEGYGGWAFRMEIVPIESAYPGYGDLIVSKRVYI